MKNVTLCEGGGGAGSGGYFNGPCAILKFSKHFGASLIKKMSIYKMLKEGNLGPRDRYGYFNSEIQLRGVLN